MRKLELIAKRIEEEKLRNEKMPIIVEGSRDIGALREMGFEGIILKVNNGQSLEKFSSEISSKYSEVILLFDWDSRGVYLTKRIFSLLSSMGTKCHIELWSFLKKYPIGSVEELPSYLKILEAQAP